VDYQVLKSTEKNIIECTTNGPNLIKGEQDALDLVVACGENATNLLLIHSMNLPAEFFQLKTGLAGCVLLKFSTYYLKVAAVLNPEEVNQGRFQEMALETNRGNEFRIFHDSQQAIEWLVGD
jgi:PadR family transcriptional regulator, regulatory protein AphA